MKYTNLSELRNLNPNIDIRINTTIVKEIIKRPTFEAPKLWINPEITNFYDFTIDDVKLVDYNSNPSDFKFEVAV